MATKRPRRRQKGYATDPEDDEAVETLLDFVPGPTLPAVPIANSWNYGATSGTGLPRKMALQPTLDTNRIAKRIDAGIDMAEKRSQSPPSRKISNGNLEPLGARIRKTAPRNPAPVPRRNKRQPTPDQAQLMDSLRDVTHSPAGSDATPPPPVAQTVSTDSSPPAEPPLPRQLSDSLNDTLYPSPLKRPGDHINNPIVRSTPDRQSSVDNASEVSWNLERDIHEDDLQRTRPSKYRGERQGQNITKPPRRPSGLSMIQDTILEENEEGQEGLLSQPAKGNRTLVEAASGRSPGVWDAAVRTIIPQKYESESRTVSTDSTSRLPRKGSLSQQIWSAISSKRSGSGHKRSVRARLTNWLRVMLILLFPLGLFYAFQYQSEMLQGLQNLQSETVGRIRWCLPFGGYPFDFSSNITDSAAFYGLQSQVTRMNSQVSSLSLELSSIRAEVSQSPQTTGIVIPGRPVQPVPKINFLSPGLGAIVDPRAGMTSPTAGHKPTWGQWFFLRVPGLSGYAGYQEPPDANTALQPWNDVGDCWCSVPRDGVSQLSVKLQHPIIPEEVVVEHIPFTATPDPFAAPKDIEVWARYGVFPSSSPKLISSEDSEPSSKRGSFLPWKSDPQTQAKEAWRKEIDLAVPVTDESIPLVVMSTLRIANKGIPESEYSGDTTLGPGFYRIGKMRYDVLSTENIQRFPIDSIIEIPHLRVDEVTFRIKSNWGSGHTCIYRFRLHGHR